MSRSTRIALIALGASLILGWLGDQLLFFSAGLGLSSLLWAGGLVAAVSAIARWGERPLAGEGRWLLAAAVLFAGGLVWRSSPVLQFLDLLAIAICLGLAALTSREGSLSRAGVISYPLGLALAGAHHLIGPFRLLFNDVNWQEIPRGRWSQRAAALTRGLLIAIPLLLVFGGLFTAADAVFEEMVLSLFDLDIPRLFGHLVGTLFFGYLTAGFLRTALLRESGELPQISRPATFALGPIETGVILGLLNLLFLAFVLVQVRYRFGGAALVQATVDLTYAEYARHGFFELVQVTALVLPVLLLLHWLVPPEQAAEQRLYRWLGGSLVAMLFVIMASAVQRMSLYQQEYGLTELRLYTTAFMGWMALLFAWFLATVLRGQRERFALGALVSGLLVLAALHAVNPDALIIRTNLALQPSTGRFDAAYAASLSPDAVPTLVSALPQLSEQDQQQIRADLGRRLEHRQRRDWRSWNWGRSRAQEAIADLSAQKE